MMVFYHCLFLALLAQFFSSLTKVDGPYPLSDVHFIQYGTQRELREIWLGSMFC